MGCAASCSCGHNETRRAPGDIGVIVAGTAVYATAIISGPHPWAIFLYIAAYLALGYYVIFKAIRGIFTQDIFNENFLMTISTLGAFMIGEYPEAVAVMLFFRVGEHFEKLASGRARNAIRSLVASAPVSANVERGGDARQGVAGADCVADRLHRAG